MSPSGTISEDTPFVCQDMTITRRINKLCNTPGTPVWQRNYFEHIIRSNKALDTIRRYILNNPTRWELDRYYPMQSEPDHKSRVSGN